MGASCTPWRYDLDMSKVIQIRDVPEDVRDAPAEAAHAQGYPWRDTCGESWDIWPSAPR